MKESQRWVDTLVSLHQRMNANKGWVYRAPVFADIRVFSYPILLIGLYCYGRYKHTRKEKALALYLLLNTATVFIINYIIKARVHKERPYITLWLTTPKEELFLNNIPKDTFPSDHAAVSATIAMWLLLRWVKNKEKAYIYLSIPFRFFSLSMWITRIMIGIHRPTDIIVGRGIGIVIAIILIQRKKIEYSRNYIITIEEKILKKIQKK